MKIHKRVLWIAKENKTKQNFRKLLTRCLEYSVLNGITSQKQHNKQSLEDNSLDLHRNGTAVLFVTLSLSSK